MHVCIILHNMIVEAWIEGCQSEMFEVAREETETGTFIDEDGAEKPFLWKYRSGISQTEVHAVIEISWG